MSDGLEIRDTGVSILDVLELIARGRGYDSILNRYPQISFFDIGFAAATARDIIVRLGTAATPLAREDAAWTESETRELVKLYRSGASPEKMSRIFLRSKDEIERRLTQLTIKLSQENGRR